MTLKNSNCLIFMIISIVMFSKSDGVHPNRELSLIGDEINSIFINLNRKNIISIEMMLCFSLILIIGYGCFRWIWILSVVLIFGYGYFN